MINSYEHLLPPSWKTQVAAWLAEDTPSFDYGGYVVGEVLREAFLFGKGSQPAVLAGSPFVTEIFAQLGCEVEWHVKEGDTFEPVKHIATVRGKARFLLLGERIALNLLARCSGIATKSKRIKDLARGYGFMGTIAGTRKTTPGFRLVEKYGMLVGGIDSHRHDLSSMIMLKDNHIWSSGEFLFSNNQNAKRVLISVLGSITAAIQQARKVGGFSLLLDVEVQSEAEADEAIDAGADVIMLDNIEGSELASVARSLKTKWKGQRKFLFETSGNITEANLQERAINDIDILSTSVVHQSVQHIDFSLKIQKPKA
ncbi:Nicotinate-nucleotide pyrophosphorylase [carboxylating] [Psilocybe cubensis]|uniref:Nicotinate-nucleotide pyrophosphorylase [carboxylating] n=2 Tax=Psilocybe cubensis TaxID=181762 RepID=A0A8H8CL26_PSICU|nr:Nicotinate-nucleotide pyrophosphorylase [carboxylating] [Psilocybe cubensis]KAH9482760.1 Nicotinate-nucleotide pyrophosphorylase [carboxylating] [Psilocybe cubensis]